MEVEINNIKFDEIVFNNSSKLLKEKYNNFNNWRHEKSLYARKKTIVKFCKTVGLDLDYCGDNAYWFIVTDSKKYTFAKLIHGV